MQKKVTITTIVIMVLVFLGVTIGIYMLTGSNYNRKSEELTSKIEVAQSELDALKASKDQNGFTPSEVVKAFFNEVKSGAVEKTKLYLSPEIQDMDTQATLKLGSDVENVTTGDFLEETTGEDVNVSMTFILATEETTVRIFTLTKYDGAWKITGVVAE